MRRDLTAVWHLPEYRWHVPKELTVNGAGKDSRARKRLYLMPRWTLRLFLCISLMVAVFMAGGRLLPDAAVVRVVSQKGGRSQRHGLVLLGDTELIEVGRVWTVYVRTPAWADADMQVVEQSTEIESLDVSGTSISDAGIRYLKNLRCLRHLSVAGTRITDGAIQTISEIPTLESVDLSQTQIKGHGLHLLKGLAKLRWLDVSNVELDNQGVLELQQLIRDNSICKVKWH